MPFGGGHWPGAVGVDGLGYAAIIDVVGVFDAFSHGAIAGFGHHTGHPIAVIPGVVGDFAGGGVYSAGAVAFVVVGVGVLAVAEQAIVVTGSVVSVIAGRVIGVGFVGLVGVVAACEFVTGIIGVVAGAIGGGELGETVGGIVGKALVGDGCF